MKKKDSTTISEAVHEIISASEHLQVHPIVIRLAKLYTGSNDRKVVYQWITENKGKKCIIDIGIDPIVNSPVHLTKTT